MMNVTTEATNTPKIYVACLASYNNGMSYGRWLDVGNDADELEAEVTEMLKGSPTPNAEEWIIQDSENLGRIDEYAHLHTIVMKAGFIEEHGELGIEVLDHCCGDLDDAVDMMDRYCGEYDSEEDYAIQYVEDCYDLKNMSALAHYIDYAAFARDLFYDYVSIDLNGMTHVFSN